MTRTPKEGERMKKAIARRSEQAIAKVGSCKLPALQGDKIESYLDADDLQRSQRGDEGLHALQESISLSIETTGAILQVSLLRAQVQGEGEIA